MRINQWIIMSYVLCIMSYVLCIMFYNPDLLTNFSEPHVYTKFYTNFHSDAFRHLLMSSSGSSVYQ